MVMSLRAERSGAKQSLKYMKILMRLLLRQLADRNDSIL